MLSVLQVSYELAAVSRDAVGGAEQVIAAIDASLVAAGCDSAVLAPSGSRLAGRLIPTRPVGATLDGRTREEAIHAQAAALRAALATERFDVIHLHGLHFERVLPEGHPPAIVTLHLPPAWYAPGALQRRRDVALVCVSDAQARALPPGAPLAAVVPNGVQLDVFRPGDARDGYALVLSRIAPEKGVHLALEAARRAGVPLVAAGAVFGYPEHIRYFEAQVRPRLDRMRRFVGSVSQAEKARLLARARCVVIPSLAPETSSLVAMEALACGTPVVARRVGALPEIVEDGVTGLLVDGVEEMAHAIRDAGGLSQRACRRAAESRFSQDAMVSGYRAVYRRLARENPAPPRRTAAARLRVEELHGLGALSDLGEAWSGLADRDPGATPFQRPEWLLPYCRAFGVHEPWALAAYRGERLAALAPLVVYVERGRRIATLLGGGRSDWQDFLVDPALDPDGASALLARLAERHAAYDALLLERLPADGWLARSRAPAGMIVAEDASDEPCPVLTLPRGPEGLFGRVAPHVFENVRYGRRRLARAGPVEILQAELHDLDVHMAALSSLHAARWAARGETGVLADERVRRFHADAAHALAASGRLRAYRLVVGGRVAAAWHGFEDHGRVFYYLGGFDPAFRAASPGAVLLAHALEEAIRGGARELDLLRGAEPYKYEWGATDRAALRRVLLPDPVSRQKDGVERIRPRRPLRAGYDDEPVRADGRDRQRGGGAAADPVARGATAPGLGDI